MGRRERNPLIAGSCNWPKRGDAGGQLIPPTAGPPFEQAAQIAAPFVMRGRSAAL